MLLTGTIRKSLMITLLMPLLMVAGCSSPTKPSPTFPTNMNVIQLADGGVCLDAESAKRLADFRAELEAW